MKNHCIFTCLFTTLFLVNCTSGLLKEKLIFEKEITENNGFSWKYSKYQNHIEISTNQKVIISEKCDSIIAVSDTISTSFITQIGEDSLSFYDSEGCNYINYEDEITSYEISRISGTKFICVTNKDGHNGIYSLEGDTIVSVENRYFCSLYNEHNLLHNDYHQWETAYIVIEDEFNQKSVINFSGDIIVPFIDCDYIKLFTKDDEEIVVPLGYMFKKSGLYGMFNIHGQIVVPPHYQKIECDYIGYGHDIPYWLVYTEDEVGLYSNNGNYVVQCGYFDEINVMTDFEQRENIWVRCTKEYDEYYKYAALDTMGKTIIPLQRKSVFLDNGKWKYHDDDSSVREYEFPNHVQKYHIGGAYNYEVTVEFYNNYIIVNNSKLTPTGMHDGWVTYENTSWGGAETYYYLNTNYTMMHVMKMWDQWNGGYDYDYTRMTKIDDNQTITDYSGVNNFTNNNFVGYSESNNGTVGISEDNSRWESYYRDNYRKRENLIQSHIQSLQTLQSDNNPNGITSYSINEIKRLIKESQREMSNLRNEAAQKGIIINQSSYETMYF